MVPAAIPNDIRDMDPYYHQLGLKALVLEKILNQQAHPKCLFRSLREAEYLV